MSLVKKPEMTEKKVAANRRREGRALATRTLFATMYKKTKRVRGGVAEMRRERYS
jgi:hypothetical protein